MTPKQEKELISVLKSGDFTVSYHDNQACIIYKGKYKEASDCPNVWDENDENELECNVNFWDMEESFDGYTPEVVYYLVKALGGKSNSC